MTELLRLRPLAPEDRECIETIHVSGHALARQINEILDLSKIEAGRMSLEEIEFDLHALTNTTLRIFHAQVQAKGLVLNEIIDPTIPFMLSGDAHKIRQIITNLVGNAVKFTDHGNIGLHIFTVSREESSIVLRFEVSDTGPGIPEAQLQDIFSPFTQANESITRNYGGTGLGTTICKNLVQLMGGRIGVESQVDAGSTFWFEIPLLLGSTSASSAENNWTKRCRILYFSSQHDEFDEIPGKLAELGIHCDKSTTLDETRKSLADGSTYDALLINSLSEPGLIDCIRAEELDLPVDTPVIAITNNSTQVLNTSTGIPVFILDKPFEQNMLFNALHACHLRSGSGADIIEFNHAYIPPEATQRQLNVLVGDDNATNRIVLQRMLEKLGYRYSIVNGGEAVLRALEDEQYDAVIIDKNMPDMGGLEVFQAYRFAHGDDNHVKFAILTADATEESRTSCTAAGIEYFLTKPVSLSKLSETLTEMCSIDVDASAARTETDTAKTQPCETADVFNPDEFEKLSDLSGGDSNFINQIVSNFIKDANENIRQLEYAVSRHDWLAFRDQAHALKGSSLYLGLDRLAELSKQSQDIKQEDFLKHGITRVMDIRKAADEAFEILQNKLDEYTHQGMTG